MAIRTVVTRGYGNGTFAGRIRLVAVRGYAVAKPLNQKPMLVNVSSGGM